MSTENAWYFLHPFQQDVWLTLLCVSLATGIVLQIVCHLAKKELSGGIEISVGLADLTKDF